MERDVCLAPYTASWGLQELNYTVKHSSGKRMQIRLLTDVSGYLRPGELAALVCKPPT